MLYRDVARLAADLQQARDRRHADVQRGQLDGLRGLGPAPLRRGDTDGTDIYRAGRLAGELYRHLLELRGSLDERTMLAAGVYGASIAQAAVQDRFVEPSVRALVEEHTAACIRITRKGLEITAEEERALFDWLAGSIDVPIEPSLLARYARTRERRISRLESE